MVAIFERRQEWFEGGLARDALSLAVVGISSENLVGTLAALHHTGALRDRQRVQIERDDVVTGHRLWHCGDRIVHRSVKVLGAQLQRVMIGAKFLSHPIGVFKFVAGVGAHGLETNTVGGNIFDTRLRHERHEQT